MKKASPFIYHRLVFGNKMMIDNVNSDPMGIVGFLKGKQNTNRNALFCSSIKRPVAWMEYSGNVL